ncbi:MAG: ribulose-phosphate 3-epimerase [Candidatus Hydrogenedentes bacterium]|nr:ribulose-phosphate 3-epimerase [Candidatus Hydrogenedentota bacterium]
MTHTIWSASVLRCDLGRLAESAKELESAGCADLHVDVADGSFTPDFALGPDAVRALRDACGLPCAAHLMVEQPGKHIDRFIQAGCAAIYTHAEADIHAHRALAQIRDAGAEAGLAVCPSTPLTKIQYLMGGADRLLVLASDPLGAAAYLPGTLDRVRILRENLDYLASRARIEVEGNLTVQDAALLSREGADGIILDRAEVLNSEDLTKCLKDYFVAFEESRVTA